MSSTLAGAAVPHASLATRPTLPNRLLARLPARLRTLVREPLLQFLLLGAVIFVVAHFIEHQRSTAEREVLVHDDLVRRLGQLYQLQMGSPPPPERMEQLIETYVRDEVMYREAMRMGLDQGDEIVRRRLIQKIDFLNRDLTAVPEPSEAELQAYHDAHAAEFSEPARVSFTHVYFSPDIAGSDDARQRAEHSLPALVASGQVRAAELGDRFPLRDDYAQLNPDELVQLFGESPLVEALLHTAPGQWAGPFASGYGWHLVRLQQRSDAHVPPLDRVRERVRQAWIDATRESANRASFDELRGRYTVIRADSGRQQP